MSDFKVIVPESTVNLIQNPSVELAATGWAAWVGGSVARVTSQQRFGFASLQVTPPADSLRGAYYSAGWAGAAGTTYAVSIYIKGVAGVTYNLLAWDGTDFFTVDTVVASGAWERLDGTFAATRTATHCPIVAKVGSSTGAFYLDGLQVEGKAYATTYADGDQPGCSWNGVKHASASTRRVTSRAGGRVRDLYDDLGFLVTGMQGIGMPGITNQQTEYALLPGALHEGTKVGQATALLTGSIKGTSLANLHTKRRLLVDAFKPDLKTREPVLLQYTGAGATLELPVHYAAGLTLQKLDVAVEELALQLEAPDPFWRAEADTVVTLDEADAVANVNYVIGRINGLWQALGTGTNGVVQAIAVAPDGKVYVGGEFTQAGGVACANIARWDGAAFSALGSGVSGGDVKSIAVAPNGDVYVVGAFTTAGGSGANRIAKWNGSSWAALGTGLNSYANAVAVASDGTVYVTGVFTTAGGTAAEKVAKYAGGTWAAMGAGLTGGMSPTGYALAIGPSGEVYVGGKFTTAGGVTSACVAKWTGAAFAAMAGIPTGGTWADVVYALAIGRDGRVYAGGAFGTGAIDTDNLAEWNGTSWTVVGQGTSSTILSLAVDQNGYLWVGGYFTEIGGNELADRIAWWTGTDFEHLDVDLPGSAHVYTIAIDARGDVYLGFETSGSASAAGKTTISLAGSVEAYPVIAVKRTGGTSATLQSVRNQTTDERLMFDYALADGEELTIDLTPGAKRITSSAYGNVLGSFLPGSDFGSFSLTPGTNEVYLYVSSAGSPTITAYLRYRTRYWGADV